jgi:hypothetical protein
VTVSHPHYQSHITASLGIAIWHQNLLGWDMFLKGYTLETGIYRSAWFHPNPTQGRLGHKIGIQCNCIIQGNMGWQKQLYTWQIQSRVMAKLRARLQGQARQLYQHPSKLEKWYPKIRSVPIDDRVKRSMSHLLHWLLRVNHQAQMSKILHLEAAIGQHSIHQYHNI